MAFWSLEVMVWVKKFSRTLCFGTEFHKSGHSVLAHFHPQKYGVKADCSTQSIMVLIFPQKGKGFIPHFSNFLQFATLDSNFLYLSYFSSFLHFSWDLIMSIFHFLVLKNMYHFSLFFLFPILIWLVYSDAKTSIAYF